MANTFFIGAIDQGTTGTRFMIFDNAGAVSGAAYREHRQIYPKPGWVEHDPLEIWNNTQTVIRECLQTSGIAPSAIAAIGITNQRETIIAWDCNSGEPCANAIVWQDTRTREYCRDLDTPYCNTLIRKKTGLVISTYFSGSKIAWLLENMPGLREKAERGDVVFGTIDSWLIWNLTAGTFVTDYSNASRTLLMNIETLEWDADLLQLFGVPAASLAEIRPTSDRQVYGTTDPHGVFGVEIPVCAALGDQQAALFGQACFNPGDAKNTYGTGSFIVLNTGTQIVSSGSGLLTTVAYGSERHRATYALEGSLAITGAAVQWLRDNLGLITNAAETERIAAEVEDTGGMYFVPAFSGLFAPYWDMSARGTMVGMTRFTNRAHVVRATLESICFQTRDVLEAMRKDLGAGPETLKVDGGAVVNNLLMQMQADILGMPCIRPRVIDSTALGAAYAAGLAVDYWEGLEQLRSHWQADRTFTPQWEEKRRISAYEGWRRAVERSRNWME